MRINLSRAAAIAAAALLAAGASAAAAHGFHHHRFPPPPPPPPQPSGFTDTVFFNGASLSHPAPGGSKPLTNPDDLSYGDGHIFTCFQNGVGPQGQASSTGNLDSTVVELTRSGQTAGQWDILGKCDGMTFDPDRGLVYASVNEDGSSSLYTIDPSSGAITHYTYNGPLPHDGGTDAITFYGGLTLISASAPGTTGTTPAPNASFPAVYRVTLDPATTVATVQPLFSDEASATLANSGPGFGSTVTLGLTDPDSNGVVPFNAERFGGDFMETSQGDQQQVFVSWPGWPWQSLSVLNLSASVDDSAWPANRSGTLYTTDNGGDTIDAVTGPFDPGSEIAAVTPCDSNSAPATCPGPGYPANYLGQVDPWTGAITPLSVSGPSFAPQGLLFLP
jgi:hypothetical protein